MKYCHRPRYFYFAGLLLFTLLLSGCTFRQNQAALAVDIGPQLTQAHLLAEARQYSAALGQLEQAATLAQADPRPLVERGEIYLRQHRWFLAQAAFEQALDRAPTNYPATVGLALATAEQGRGQEAIALWRQAIAFDAQQAEGWVGLGQSSLASYDYAAAKEAFTEALARVPNPEAQWALAALTLPTDLTMGRTLLTQMTALTGQRDHLLAALAPFTPQSPPAEVAKITGIALIQLEAWPLAHHALRIATREDPTDPQAWAFLGHVQGMVNLPALEAFREAKRLDPDLALTPYFEGLYLRRRGLYAQAVDRFLTALELDPNNLGIALETAQTLADMGDYLSAEAWYRSLVQLEPEATIYQEVLTAFYIEHGYRVADLGLTEAERLAEIAPESARAHDLLGWARFQTGDFLGAETALRRAIALDPTAVAPRYHLGRLLEALSRDGEARAEFTRVIDWDTSGVYRDRLLGGEN